MIKPVFSVFYDACILYPAPLRDIFMQLALTGVFRARWSDKVHEEWIYNLLKKRSDLSSEKLLKVSKLMNKHSPDSLVTDYEFLVNSISLPDINDRHVVAAAYHGKCDTVITFNLKDFPDKDLKTYNLHSQHPDDFLVYTFDLSPDLILSAISKVRKRLKNPPKTREEYLEILKKQGIPNFVKILEDNKANI